MSGGRCEGVTPRRCRETNDSAVNNEARENNDRTKAGQRAFPGPMKRKAVEDIWRGRSSGGASEFKSYSR